MARARFLIERYFPYLIILVAFLVPLALILLSYITIDIYYQNYIPELLAGFLGIFLGIYLEAEIRLKKDRQRALELSVILKDEVNEIVKRAKAGNGNYLETQAWQSMVHSGDIALLEIEFQKALFYFYARVNAHNIDMAAYRSASISAASLLINEKSATASQVPTSTKIHKKEKEIIGLAKGILNQPYWEKS